MAARKEFAVVYTIETPKAKAINVHVVPTKWIDGNFLRYPSIKLGRDKVINMIKAAEFIPIDLKWKKFAFIVKKYFPTYEAALAYSLQKEQSTDTDTDADNANLIKLQQQQARLQSPKNKCNIALYFNCLTCDCLYYFF